ncbi:MAG: insulinase family protein [Myxococcales bacterium]|nr:insulinase family protein [Myxococcales bacterium]
MRSMILATLLLSSTAIAAAPKGAKNAAQLKQWELPNGMKVLFLPDHKAPVVTVQVFYHAGAKDEPAGKRGIAHMFEHMMFKGSTHVAPEEHARFIALVGGEYNAFTQDDATGYHDTVPPSALDFTMKLEAERMRNLKLTQKTIDSERQVVEEELRQKVENNPVGKALRAELAMAYTVHPYRVSPAGEKSDLDTVTPADCQKFYDEYYRPNNAALVVVGDTDDATVKALADKYFAPLEKGPTAHHDAPKEPEQNDLRQKTLEIPVQLPVIIGGYHIPAGNDPDLFALEVLQQILSSGESSRLHQRLVRKDKTAVAAGGFVFAHEDPGLFLTFALYLPNMNVEKLKAALDEEIAKVASTKVDAHELQKAKNQLAARAVYQRERVTGLASNIGVDWVVAHDPARPFTSAAKFDAVTADDVMRVAKKYLVKTNLSMLTLVPAKPASASTAGGKK